MKAQSLGKRSSRCVRPELKEQDQGFIPNDLKQYFQKNSVSGELTGEYLQAYLGQRGQSSLVEHTDAAYFLDFSRVHSLSSNGFQDVPHRSRLLKRSLKKILENPDTMRPELHRKFSVAKHSAGSTLITYF